MAFTEIDGRAALIHRRGLWFKFSLYRTQLDSLLPELQCICISNFHYLRYDSTNRQESESRTRVKPCTMLLALYYLFINVVNIFMNYRLELPPPASSSRWANESYLSQKCLDGELKTQSWINKSMETNYEID